MKETNQARTDVQSIWQAGVNAVRSDVLVRQRLVIRDGRLDCAPVSMALAEIERILVVGAGKAGAGMATGVEQVIAESDFANKPLSGWINIPADCVRPMSHIHLHAARPGGRNEPTEAGVFGSKKILDIVRSAGHRDLVLCLISGGGSALLPLPVDSVAWQDKMTVTQMLSDAGADIRQMNTVRKQLSAIKGGGLARACQGARMLTLILSDVVGDPLDAIASGPTVPNTTTVHDAIAILEQFLPDQDKIPPSVRQYLGRKRDENQLDETNPFTNVTNIIIGNNQTAVEAARAQAELLGYHVVVLPTRINEGTAEEVAAVLIAAAQNQPARTCIVSGGEPTVRLVDSKRRGVGGRNQQLVLAALVELIDNSASKPMLEEIQKTHAFALLSGGTDGEDGPTDAAGAILDAALCKQIQLDRIDPRPYLRDNDAYTFFSQYESLLITGPTHTNVCDLRVVIV